MATSTPGVDLALLSSDYVEQLFALYQDDSSQVPTEWQNYFRSLQNGPVTIEPAAANVRPAQPVSGYPRAAYPLGGDGGATTIVPAATPAVESNGAGTVEAAPSPGTNGANGMADGMAAPTYRNGNALVVIPEFEGEVNRESGSALAAGGRTRELHNFTRKQEYVDLLIRNYRVRGHLVAKVDPLGMPRPMPPELDPQFYGLTEADLDRRFSTDSLAGSNAQTLRDIIERLRNTYCRSIGVQFMHIDDLAVRDWLQDRDGGHRENRLQLSPRRAAAHPHAADRRRDLRGVHPEASSSARRAFRSKAPRA